MNFLYVFTFSLLVIISNGDDFRFTLTKPDGEVIEGNLLKLDRLKQDVKDKIEAAEGFKKFMEDFGTTWKNAETKLKEKKAAKNETIAVLSNLYWDQTEAEFTLIGWKLNVTNRIPLFLA